MQQQQQQHQQPQTMLQHQQVRQTVHQQQPQQQSQIPNIVTIQSGATMTSQQLQQLQLKQQQMNQQQKYQQMNQQQQQQIQMQQQQMKSQPQQIQLISANANNNQQFYQTNLTMQHQYNQQLTANSNMATSISMTSASPMTPFQANSPQQPPTPQQQQSNQSSPSPNLKLSTQHHQSTLSPINQNILLGNNSNLMTSPVKNEPTSHGGGHANYQQNKSDLKTTIKTEDHHQNRRPGMQAIDNEFDSDITDVADLIGVDLAAEKKTLLASSTGKSSSLDQIRACKDEKFLNIMILHKKFVDIGKTNDKSKIQY